MARYASIVTMEAAARREADGEVNMKLMQVNGVATWLRVTYQERIDDFTYNLDRRKTLPLTRGQAAWHIEQFHKEKT